MDLKTQLLLLTFSFIYGMIFSSLINLNYKLLYNEKKLLRICFTILFVLVSVLIYFFVLLKINYGILHIYSLLMIIVGFILELIFENKLIPILVAYYKKKWYNHIVGMVIIWLNVKRKLAELQSTV